MSYSNFSDILLRWYHNNKRNLPWRDTNNPYRIWISEIILQQTQVKQGYSYFLRFVERFPNVYELAKADEDEVLKYWQGLGYYSRARNLHKAAKSIWENGSFPNDYQSIRSLKGVGDYTAAAIASFAFGQHYAVVDGNVYRVLSRYFGIKTPIDISEGKKYYKELANELLPKDDTSPKYNQAIMDFGALQCTPLNPKCVSCPLNDSCVALSLNDVRSYPCKSKKIAISERFFNYFFIEFNKSFLMFKRGTDDIWAGLYEPLLVEQNSVLNDIEDFKKLLSPYIIYNEIPEVRILDKNIRHKLTHRTLHCNFYHIKLRELPTLINPFKGCWVNHSQLSLYAFPKVIDTIMKKYIY